MKERILRLKNMNYATANGITVKKDKRSQEKKTNAPFPIDN